MKYCSYVGSYFSFFCNIFKENEKLMIFKLDIWKLFTYICSSNLMFLAKMWFTIG